MRKYFTFVILISVLLVSQEVEARRQSRLPTFEWGLKVGIAGIYNDNVLRLSETDQDAFRRSSSTFRTPLETIDDGETEFSIAPAIQWRAPANLMAIGAYRFKTVQRLNNEFSSYQTHSFSATLRPRTKGYRWSAKLSVFAIPDFYLRVYRDRDFGTYHDTRFKNFEYSGEFSIRPLPQVWLAGQSGFGSIYYDKRFTEFDSEFYEIGGEVRYSAPWASTVSLRYTRRNSDNIGKSQQFLYYPSFESDVVLEDNEYGDADNTEDELRLVLRSPLRLAQELSLDASITTRIRRRVYSTMNSLESDPFHRGRLDNRWEVTPSLSFPVNSAIDIEVFYTHEERKSESDVEGVPRVKDFDRNEIGIGATYSLR